MGRLVEPVKKEKKFRRIASDHPLANCEPLGDRVVIRRDTPKKESRGGILLPSNSELATTKLPAGTVVRVGPGKRDDNGNLVPMAVRVGDRVLLSHWAGTEIRDPSASRQAGDEFVILREEEIQAKIPREE